MASLDVRDVLNIQPDAGGASNGGGLRPSKKQKTASAAAAAMASRPNLKGLAREVQSLGGNSPISIVPQYFKKRRVVSRKPAARWELRRFKNTARDDTSLILSHWRRKTEPNPSDLQSQQTRALSVSEDTLTAADRQKRADAAKELEDSAFAKFNVKVTVPEYTDDQYHAELQNPAWTKEETDYLLQLVRDFDLRWPLIWDRYDYHAAGEAPSQNNPGASMETSDSAATDASSSMALIAAPQPDDRSRTMEDLKARYYEVAAKMMAIEKPAQYMTQAEYTLHGVMASFNPEKEKLRKAFVTNALGRSMEEVREEEALLLEVRRIMARVERTNEERREIYSRLDFPPTDQEKDISAFKTSAGLQTLLQNLMFNSEKSRKRKSVAAGESVNPASAGAVGSSGLAVAGSGAAESSSRRESIAASATGGGHYRRESLTSAGEKAGGPDSAGLAGSVGSAVTPTTGKSSKKGGAMAERRKLTGQEQEVYGVSYHDRLGSGPTFRYEKINKLFTHKSGQQQMRITNILNELDMPARLFMPTASVTAQFEQLVNAIVQLVDLRKVSDKLDGEIKIEEQRKLERDKAKAILSGQTGGAAEGGTSAGNKFKDTDKHAKQSSTAASSIKVDKIADSQKGSKKEQTQSGDSTAPLSKDTATKEDKADDVAEDKNDGADATATATKAEGSRGGRSQAASGSRPGSSSGSKADALGATHKRSASVLSVASDKSVKRQKK